MESMMEQKLIQLDRYLENTEALFKALVDNDLEGMNLCLDRNRDIMKRYDQTERINYGSPRSRIIRERIERISQINQQCFLYAEERCRALSKEIENTDKNRSGIRKYGAKQTQTPRFIDHKI
jgi:hypothetical protein